VGEWTHHNGILPPGLVGVLAFFDWLRNQDDDASMSPEERARVKAMGDEVEQHFSGDW
jgi:hypothetical protein